LKDAKFSLSKALPNANANNNTSTIDLNGSGSFTEQWRLGYISVAIPALSDHTNTSVTNLITLKHSDEAAANFADSDPLIQIKVVGVASTGSAAKTVKVPLPPAVKRYVQFNQLVPTNGGIENNAAVTYDLIV
jgi:hypothetical protein